MRIKTIAFVVFFAAIFSLKSNALISQEQEKAVTPGNEKIELKKPDDISPTAAGSSDEESKKKDNKKDNLNLDAKMLYGQYNNIRWAGSITQNFKSYTYRANTDFRRSNDYGKANSNFYESELGFTGSGSLTDSWKSTQDIKIDNESHGMARNLFYRREEKDRVIVSLKNEWKPMPTRWEIDLGGAYYANRHDVNFFPIKTGSNFYKARAGFAWEYIWSASNSLKLESNYSEYIYSKKSNNDSHAATDLLACFKLTEFFMFHIGPRYAYNRDYGHFYSGKIDVSTTGIKLLSVNLSYVYDLYPFNPEEFYFSKKYMQPNYDLPPGKGHHGDIKIGIDYRKSENKPLYVKKIKMKTTASYISNSKYYNYFTMYDNLLTGLPTRVTGCKVKGEAGLGLSIIDAYIELGANYEYAYYYASDYITYAPEYIAGGYFLLSISRFELEYNNQFRDGVFIYPYAKWRLSSVMLGNLNLQFKIMDSFFLYGRIDNIYNKKFSNRWGYPESGRTIIGGFRILI